MIQVRLFLFRSRGTLARHFELPSVNDDAVRHRRRQSWRAQTVVVALSEQAVIIGLCLVEGSRFEWNEPRGLAAEVDGDGEVCVVMAVALP